jgi:hypothetical protein
MWSAIVSVIGWFFGLLTGKKENEARELGRKEAELEARRQDAVVEEC